MEKFGLTFPESNIWLVENYYNSQKINIISGSLNFKKDFDIDLAEKTVNKFVELNDALRIEITIKNSIPYQYVIPFKSFKVDKIDVKNKTSEEIDQIKNEYILAPFDIIEKPLFSYLLLDKGNKKGEIFLKAHHIICDGWSGSKMVMELANIYDKFLNNEGNFEKYPSYIEYIKKEEEYKNSEKFSNDEKYWEEYLKGYNELVSIKNVKTSNTDAKRFSIRLEENLNKLILEYCKNNKFSPYVLFTSALAIYLSKINEKKDIVIGSPILNRLNFSEKNMQGMFISTIPVRFQIDYKDTFTNLCKNTSKEAMVSFRHERYPISKTIEKFKNVNSSEPLFNIMVSYQNARAKFDKKDTYSMSWNFSQNIQNELEVHIIDLNDEGILEVDYDYLTSLFNETEIKYIAKRIENIIREGITQDKKIKDINILTKEEENKLLYEFNNNKTTYPKDSSIIEIFKEILSIHPKKMAVIHKNKSYSYEELNEKSNYIANYLINSGIKMGDTVGIMQAKQIDIIPTIIGIMKCGAIYVPIDPNLSINMKRHIINNSNVRLILSEEDRANIDNIKIININKINSTIEEAFVKTTPQDVVSIMYTSGTTGTPKGVKISNRNIVRLVKDTNYLTLYKEDKMLQTASFTFDASILEVFNGLLNGVTLYMIKEELLDPSLFKEYIITNNITVVFLTAAIFNQMISYDAEMFKDVRVLMTGGEAISKSHALTLKKICPNVILKNLYGPTENGVVSTYYDVIGNEDIIPIGKAVSNTNCYILNSDKKLTPLYVPGILYLSGDGLSEGYVNNLDLTREKFSFINSEIIYDTGDVAYYNEDGNIIFLGRKDSEIKLKGIRVNLDEIKSIINKYSSVKTSEILLITDNENNKYLACVIVSDIKENLKDLKYYLKDYLPYNIMPRKFLQVDKIPLTMNGKTDKKALINLLNSQKEVIKNDSKFEGVYLTLYNIFKEVLNTHDILADDDFFEIGGDSLLGVTFVTKAIEKKLNITYNDLYKYRSIRELGDMLLLGKDTIEISKDIKNFDYSSIDALLKKNDSTSKKIKDIILTGATGYLGSHILSKFIDKFEGKAFCLVRNLNGEDAKDRLKRRLNYYFSTKYDNEIDNRIIVIPYNDELNDEVLKGINMTNVSHLINSLALVKHYGDFREFYKVNVGNVDCLSDFCIKNNLTFIHISTLSVSGDIVETAKKLENLNFVKKEFDEQNLYNGQTLDNVYAYTKFIAERHIFEKIIKNKLDARIMRMGNLSDRYLDNKFQINEKDNAFKERLKALIKIGIIPEDIKNESVDFTPVDYGAEGILKASSSGNLYVYHLFNSNKVLIDDLAKIMKEVGIDIRYGTDAEISERINYALNNNEKEKIKGIIVDITKNNNLKYITDVKIINKKTNEILEKENFVWPKITKDYLINYINRLIK